jgi:NAD(P)-dependent dehydrogenase (short-subunit alcohol dehydrogenase family)
MTSPPATPGGYSHPEALAGHTVIVTGAAQGVGKGIAGALLDRGASVLLVDHDAHTLNQTGDEFCTAAGEFEVMVADLRDPGSPRAIVETAVRRFGGLDALVNDAIATNEPKPLVDITSDDYDLVFDVGPRATFFLMQAAHPVLKAGGGGVIVNLGSASGTGGQARFAAYAAAKEAIRGMSKAAALEWGRDAVNVNVVCPFRLPRCSLLAGRRPQGLRTGPPRRPLGTGGAHTRGHRSGRGVPGEPGRPLHHRPDHHGRRRDGRIPLTHLIDSPTT